MRSRPATLLAFVAAALRSPLRRSTRPPRLAVALCLALNAMCVVPLQAAPLSGTRSVGPTGNYPSLTAAIAEVNAVGNGLGGALVLELQAGYVSSVETFPLTIPAVSGASAVNTLTIRPASGATALSISSADTTAATVDLNGARFVTLDGRPGGAGTAKQLTIENTSTSGVALRFINEAGGNNIKFVTLTGVNTSASSGTVVFSTTTGANGNDNNTIDSCDIRDGASTPANGLYSLGSTSTTAQNNSGNSVTNCNLFNFHSTAADQSGIRLDGGNTDWSITGNSFYQTTSRSGPAGLTVGAITITAGNNYLVSGNAIGGTAPGAGGTPWTINGTPEECRFAGISLNVGTNTATSVQGNTIRNVVWLTTNALTSVPGIWSGITVSQGNVDIGTVTGNTIGSGTGTGSISVTTSGNGGTSFGISSTSNGTVTIANNTIGSITVNGSTTVSASLTGIQVTAGTNTISNNIVGNTATPSPLTANLNSLNAATSSTAAGGASGQRVTGILSSSIASASITGNTVANLNNNSAQSSAGLGQVRGIFTSAGMNTITGNIVRNLATTSKNADTGKAQSIYGISDVSTVPGQTVSQNIVHSLVNTETSAGVSVTGIYFDGATGGTSVVARNFVHSLSVLSSNAASQFVGLYFGTSGTFTAQNNMVRVGRDATGASAAGASTGRGIYDEGTTSGRIFYHNSVYLGGTQTSGAAGTFAFQSTGTSNLRAFQNNIFVNARTNSGGTGKHYAIGYTTAGSATLTAGGNLFLTSGTGGVLGRCASSDCTSLSSWQAVTTQDSTSAVADPLFVNPTGNAASVNLHLQASNPAERGGVALAGTVTDDFDGETRSTLSPSDVGADAGNFFPISDIFPPAISYPLLPKSGDTNRVLTGWATITDNSGIVASGASAPRLYFKKSTDANVFNVPNDSTGNGWKYVTATGSGPYSFTIIQGIIFGGNMSVGDTIQYFVVAQDSANNLSSNPPGATASASPPVQHINFAPGNNSFAIAGFISGVKLVGAGGNYPSLSGAGGFFAALNASVPTDNVVANIISDTTEDGSVALDDLGSTNYPFSTFTVRITPNGTTMRTISGTAAAGLITLNGADRVTIDGSGSGGGRYLTLRNTGTASTSSTILFRNDSSNNAVRNCVVEGPGTGYGINFGTGTLTGNNDNVVTNCVVRDRSDAAGVPSALINSSGFSGAPNTGNTISNNECFNFKTAGIFVGGANANWTVSGNNVYDIDPQTVFGGAAGIVMNADGTNLVTQNYVHDIKSGSTAPTGGVTGISVAGAENTAVTRNRIVLNSADPTNTTVTGIGNAGVAGQVVTVSNNQITIIPSLTLATQVRGISDNSAAGGSSTFAFNTVVVGGTASGAVNSWCLLRQNPDTFSARNNLFLNVRTGGTGSHFAMGSESLSGATGLAVSNNVYAGTGAVAASFMDFSGTPGTALPVSYAAWQSSTGDTSTSASNPGGDYSTAMFVDAANGDLHLVPGGNVLVNRNGTPIAGITTDYDGSTRHASTPFIGADEIPLADIALAQTAAVADGGSIDFGTVTPGSSSAAKTFTITNPGTAALTGLSITGATGDFTVSALSGTSIPVGNGSVTFTVTFTPATSGARTTTLHISSNVTGAKNPFDLTLTGTGQSLFQAWAAANSTVADSTTLMHFASGTLPGSNTALVYTGTFAGGGTISATGTPINTFEPAAGGAQYRVLFVRRKDYITAGLSYTPKFSADLTGWVNSADEPTVLADDGTHQIVSVPYPTLAGGTEAKFFQLVVSVAL